MRWVTCYTFTWHPFRHLTSQASTAAGISHTLTFSSLSLFFGSGERELHMYGVALIPSAMLPLRCLLKTTPGIRSHARLFSTVNPSARELAYQAFGPEQGDQVERNPIIFLHGLFGSKANNRSVSR